MPLIGDASEPLMERYTRSLGGFIHDFTLLEISLFRLLCEAAELTEEIGYALFSGARADAMIQQIRRCYRARGWEALPFLESALSQITAINSLRNIAVHFVTLEVEDDDREVLATSQLRYLPENARDMRISPETLDDASKDCRVIGAVLMVASEEIRQPGSTGQLGVETAATPLSWRYKPPSQDNPRRKGSPQPRAQEDQPKRGRQPRSSRAKDQS